MKRRQRKRPRVTPKPPLTVDQILAWADEHHQRTGRWPGSKSGIIQGSIGERWGAVDMALSEGYRGLPGGSSLAQLLAEHRGVRNYKRLPPYTVDQILAWADEHYERTGDWPCIHSGAISGAPGETWACVQAALSLGARGLPGGSSLPRVLAEHRKVRKQGCLPSLTVPQLLAWADAYHQQTGQWPQCKSGPVQDSPGDTWQGVNRALTEGTRGLPGGSSLAQLLAEHRGVRNHMRLPPYTVDQILAWADEHYERTGDWPHTQSGPVHDAPEETWSTVQAALWFGCRGLPGGSSLAQLLATHRGVRNQNALPRLTTPQVLTWVDAYRERTGAWPRRTSGSIPEAPGETWKSIDVALNQGLRGLPGGSSLPRFLAEHRGCRHRLEGPPLSVEQILAWADDHYRRRGKWPTITSGRIRGSDGDTWSAVNAALREGYRGLPGRMTLSELLKKHRAIAEAAMRLLT